MKQSMFEAESHITSEVTKHVLSLEYFGYINNISFWRQFFVLNVLMYRL